MLLSAPQRRPHRPSLRNPAGLREAPGGRARPSAPPLRARPAPLPHPRLSLLWAVTATCVTAVCVAAPALTSRLAPSRAAGRAWRAVPGSHTRGGGTRGAECSGAPSLLSSSPAQRSALRCTPARSGPPAQSAGTPPPLAAAAASASSASSLRSRRGRRHLGSDGRAWGGDHRPRGPIADRVWPQGEGA